MIEPACAQRLRAVVSAAEPLLVALAETDARRCPAPGKWSPAEVLGHLIDSASNNHGRFVQAGWQEDMTFPGYEQERWVNTQLYQQAPWRELIALWVAYNRHIAWIMCAVPETARMRARTRHNLHQIAWRAIPATEAATLDYFMTDYVGHLEHHLRQILGPEWAAASLSADGQRIPTVEVRDVDRVIRRDFSAYDPAVVREILSEYGKQAHVASGHSRVELAVLKLAARDLARVREFVSDAVRDARDVLAMAEYPSSILVGWSAMTHMPHEERQKIYDADWRQYESWLNR